MIFGIAHDFHSSAARQHFIALGDSLCGVVSALGMNIGADFADDGAYVSFWKNDYGVYVGQRGENFSALRR
jgi:hypothetical protein